MPRFERVLRPTRITEELYLALYPKEENIRIQVPGENVSQRVRYALTYGLNEIAKALEHNGQLPGFDELHEELEVR